MVVMMMINDDGLPAVFFCHRILRKLQEYDEVQPALLSGATLPSVGDDDDDDGDALQATLRVQLVIDERSSRLHCEGVVACFYVLWSQQPPHPAMPIRLGWDEDDSLCLVCRPSSQAAEWRDSSLYALSDELQHYECFEYTTQPELMTVEEIARSGNDALMRLLTDRDHDLDPGLYVGKILLRLPSYGGCFHLSYVRQSKPMLCVTTNKVVRRRITLAQSASIHIRAAVHSSHPDQPTDKQTSLRFTASSSSSSSQKDTGSSNRSLLDRTLRRRGARAMGGSASLEVVVEDLRQLRVLSVSASVPQSMVGDSIAAVAATTCILSRIMAWAYMIDDAHDNRRGASLCVVFEADLIQRYSVDDILASHVSVVYGQVEVHDLRGSFGDRDVIIEVGRGHCQLESDHRIVCRLPYSLSNDDDSSSIESSAADFPVPQPTDYPSRISVRCRYCDSIITGTDIRTLKPLPTGLLDNVRS